LIRGAPIFAPLRRRDFTLLWTGLGVSLIGDGAYYVAMAWEAYKLSNTPASLSLVGVAWTAPTVLFLLLGGSLSDRLDRRQVMICSSLVQGSAVALIGALSIAGLLNLSLLLGLVGLSGAAVGFFNPALGAVIPGLVAHEELAATSALEQVARPVSLLLVGPALGGALIALGGVGPAFLFDAVTFAVASLAIGAIRHRAHGSGQPTPTTTTIAGIAEAVRFVRANPWLWCTLLAAGLSLFAGYGPSQVLLPFLLKNDLHLGGGAFGLLRALTGTGAVVAAVAIGRAGLPRRFLSVMFVAWALQALAAVGYGIASSEWEFAVISLASGLCAALGNVIWGTLLKSRVPNELLGRVSSLDWLVSIGLVPFSFAVTGPLSSALGAHLTLVLAGALACTVMIVMSVWPGVRELEVQEATPLSSARVDGATA
jgi:DHA3 family tetracycline resistance protein-like MFS transporter